MEGLRKLRKEVVSDYPFITDGKSDIRDVWLHYRDSKRAWDYLMSRLVSVDLESATAGDDLPSINCHSFDGLCHLISERMYWTPLQQDVMAICLAVTISTRIKGPLLWAYIVGGSGSGKSTICDAIAADKIHTKRVSQLTSFYSGYRTEDSNDVSLLSKLPDKTLIVPDFTSIIDGSPALQDKLFAQMRAIFDGAATAHWANALEHDYTSINFSMLAGVTHAIHAIKKSAFGERMLKIDLTQPDSNQAIVSRVIQNTSQAASASLRDNSVFDAIEETNPYMRDVKAATSSFINYLYQKISGGVELPPIPKAHAVQIQALSKLLTGFRGTTNREPHGDRDLLVRPVLEVGSHPAGQLTKLGAALCIVLDKSYDDETMRLVRKVAMDTGHGFNKDIMVSLAGQPNGTTREHLSMLARMPYTLVGKTLRDLRELDIVVGHSNAGESETYSLAPAYQDCWNTVFGPPANRLVKASRCP